MKALFLTCQLILLIVITTANDVLDLSDADFTDSVREHDTILVEFYAPWCGHCKRLAPEYDKAASILRDNDPPIPLAKVDCIDAGKDTCKKFGVSGYPTLKIFRNGEFSQEYSGPREANGIVKYMQAQVGPSSKELKNIPDVENFLTKPEVAVVGFFQSEDGELYKTFMKTADKMRESVRFAHSINSAVLESFKHKNQVVLYRAPHMKNKFEESDVTYSGDENDSDKLEQFVNKNYHGLVGHRTRENSNNFHPPLIVAYYKVDYIKNIKGTNYWRNRILKVADAYRGQITFAVSNKDEFSQELDEFGLSSGDGEKPVIAALNNKKQKFKMEQEFSPENFDKFIHDFLGNNLTPHLKSEPIPDTNDDPVKVAVAKNFDDLVTNNDKDVLIEFYAPWCGHCKKLAPAYDELGAAMENEEVEIIKMDATANDVPSPYDVTGFPTLYWAPKNQKSNPVRYDGGRELDDFIKYISNHATNELKGYDRNGKKKKSKSEL